MARNRKLLRFRRFFPVFFGLALFGGSAVGADRPAIITHPSGALLELSGSTIVRGNSPLPLSSELQGRYRVRVELAGYETAFGAISLHLQNGVLRLGEAEGFGRERVLRSLVLPGSGQMREGRGLEGSFWALATLGASIASLVTEKDYRSAHDEFVKASAALAATPAAAVGDSAFAELVHETYHLEARANDRRRDRNYTLGALGFFWGLNVIDAALFHPAFDVKEGSDGVLQVGLTERTRARQVSRSLLYPGLGQAYEGQRLRGAAYALSATAAAVTTLVSHLHFKGELDRIDALDRELEALASAGGAASGFRATVAAERDAAVRRSEDDKERRMTAAIVTGAVYAASLLDAFLSSPSEGPVETGTRIGLVAPPSAGAFGLGVRVPF